MTDWCVVVGDCIERMREMPDCSVDSIVTDPPYGLGFMGKKWDALPPGAEWAEECLRVLKPGGHVLAFGGTRTYHRLVCAIEDAGFEIRDCVFWMYGTGFPKSLDVSKAIDKAAGMKREVIGPDREAARRNKAKPRFNGTDYAGGNEWQGAAEVPLTAPATEDAAQWEGWGTALKPAVEPVVVARKPLLGTVAANVLAHGTGALNIAACKIGEGAGGTRDGEESRDRRYTERGATDFSPTLGPRGGGSDGRWPANVILDEEAAALLDEQTGTLKSGKEPAAGFFRHPDEDPQGIYGGGKGLWREEQQAGTLYGDSGGASRFFYCAKPTKGERSAGLDGLNAHPTVKPISLMRWLVRLVTPPGGTVLDPFLGSGTTGCAAVLEGFDFIGIERDPDYVKIAEARIAHWAPQPEPEWTEGPEQLEIV